MLAPRWRSSRNTLLSNHVKLVSAQYLRFTHGRTNPVGPCMTGHPRPPYIQASLSSRCEQRRRASSSPNLASEVNHRELAAKLNIYTNHDSSRGSPLFFPDGAHILLKLQEFLRAQYAIFGFEEVVTPVIYKQSLWEQSGHWQNYGDDMYEVVGRGASGQSDGKERGQDEKFGLKPMNCPGHCLLYQARPRTSNNLPIRFADFSPLHRNEISGALTGLTRLRRFHQDDGHIFCREDQVGSEIKKSLQLIDRVYKAFDLGPYSLVLSTRPAKDYIGTIETWDRAESQLQEALNVSGIDWSLNPEDGAFYGPKIDVILRDRNGKEHQTATIQLDFQLPSRFGLEYAEAIAPRDVPSVKQPVLIHRAVLGSLERFMALLLDHTGGHLPLWLSPRQVQILTVQSSPEANAYAEKVAGEIRGFEVAGDGAAPPLQPLSTERIIATIDSRAESFSKKVRDARRQNYRVLVTVGEADMANGLIAANLSALADLETVERELRQMGIPAPTNKDDKSWDRIRMRPSQLRALLLRLTASFH